MTNHYYTLHADPGVLIEPYLDRRPLLQELEYEVDRREQNVLPLLSSASHRVRLVRCAVAKSLGEGVDRVNRIKGLERLERLRARGVEGKKAVVAWVILLELQVGSPGSPSRDLTATAKHPTLTTTFAKHTTTSTIRTALSPSSHIKSRWHLAF